MALTTRVNGRTPASQINASWFNDFNDLLTGVMKDQLIAFTRNLSLTALGGAPGTFTATVVSGAGLGIGAYTYTCTLVCSDGETVSGSTPGATTTSGNQKVNLSSIPTGPAGTTARKIYRTLVGGSTFHLLTTINDNTTTTFVDTTADATITAAVSPPSHGTFGGALIIKNQSGTVKATIYSSDGAFSFDGGGITSDGGGNLRFNGGGGTTKMGRDGTGAYYIDNPDGSRAFQISSGQAVSIPGTLAVTGALTHNGNTVWDSGNDGSGSGLDADTLDTHDSSYFAPISGPNFSGTPQIGGKSIPFMVATVGTVGRQIFVGTTTPSGANEGDIWIKA